MKSAALISFLLLKNLIGSKTKKSNAKHLIINSRTFNQPIIMFFKVQFEMLRILFSRAN